MSHYLISVLPIQLLPHLAGNSASVLPRVLSARKSRLYSSAELLAIQLFIASVTMITSPQQRAILGSLTNSLLWSQHDPFHEDRALQTHLSARTPSLRSALGIELPTSEHRWTQSSSPTVSVTLLFNQTWQKATRGGKYLFCLAVWGTASHHGGRRYGGAGPVNWQQRRWPNTVFLSPPRQKNWSCELMAR